MNIKAIEQLVAQGESETLEFKTSATQLKRVFETLCAFLNGKGGTVLIGVNDKGKLVGQSVTDNTRQEIARELNKLDPTASLEVSYVELVAEKFVIAVKAEKSMHAPHTYDGRAFERNQSTTTRMTKYQYVQLLTAQGHLNCDWERADALDYTIEDLDHQEIRRAVQEGISAERIPADIPQNTVKEILFNWGLIQKDQLNHASVLLFAKHIKPDYWQCGIMLGRFRGNDMRGEIMDSQSISGNVFYLLRAAQQFVSRHLPVASSFTTSSFQRIDRPTLPVFAVREALVNALCHCDYSNPSTSISLAIFDDRMEIWNNGELPSQIQRKSLGEMHRSILRNRRISKVFYDRKLFEGWGMGISKIFELCKEAGIPRPKYSSCSGGTTISFKFKTSIGVSETAIDYVVLYDSLTSRQKELLKILSNGTGMTTSELSKQLIKISPDRTVRHDLTQLKNLKFIELVGFGPSAKWFLIAKYNKEAIKRQ